MLYDDTLVGLDHDKLRVQHRMICNDTSVGWNHMIDDISRGQHRIMCNDTLVGWDHMMYNDKGDNGTV